MPRLRARAPPSWCPGQVDISTDDKLLAWYTTQRRQAIATSATQLQIAVAAACVALALLIVALGVVWLGPGQKADSTNRQNHLPRRREREHHGVSMRSARHRRTGPSSRVKVTDGAVTRTHSIPVTWIDRVETVNGCT